MVLSCRESHVQRSRALGSLAGVPGYGEEREQFIQMGV